MSLYNSRRLSRRLSSSHSNCLSLSSHSIQPSHNDNLSHPSPFHIESHGSTQTTSTLTQHFRKSLALSPPHKLRCPRSPSLAPLWVVPHSRFRLIGWTPAQHSPSPFQSLLQHISFQWTLNIWFSIKYNDSGVDFARNIFPILNVMYLNDAWVKWTRERRHVIENVKENVKENVL